MQLPLQNGAENLLIQFWSATILNQWLLLSAIPVMLISGLVQEGAKLVPVTVYWGISGRKIDPKIGLIAGAVAGVGFGILETQWVLNSIFAANFNWSLVQGHGPIVLAGFWERFFTTGFHMAASALAGYGLAKGKGWQFYLIVSGLHTLFNYTIILVQAGILGIIVAEIAIAVIAVIVAGWSYLLRWKKDQIANQAFIGSDDSATPPNTPTPPSISNGDRT